MKHREAAPIKTEGVYLNRLGKKLLYYFPLEQVRDMLEDYQEHFFLGREQGSTDEALIAALGTPETVTAAILKEIPEGRSCLLRHMARWGIVLAFACCCLYLRYSFYDFLVLSGTYAFMILGTVSVFALLHGQGQAAIEGRFRQPLSEPTAAVYLLPLVPVILIEVIVQYLLTGAELPDFLTSYQAAMLFHKLLDTVRIILPLLLVWMLWRSFHTSICNFPIAVCTLGAIMFIQETERFLHSTKIDYVPQHFKLEAAGCLLPYGASVLLAVLFWQYIRKTSSKGN